MSASEVAIIDSGGANIASLQYALSRLGASSVLTSDPARIEAAPHVILPGVGAAGPAMERLRVASLVDVVRKLQQPLLGICLGMQLLAAGSEEEDTDCIGVFADRAELLAASPATPVPNMGWCRVRLLTDHPLMRGIADDSWFYFVHSYALPVGPATLATAAHTDEFSAVLARDNFFAAQFHPERSSTAGAQLLRNFLGIRA